MAGCTDLFAAFADWEVTQVAKRFVRPATLVAGLLLLPGCASKGRPIEVPPERYQQMVSAFYTGTVALQVNDQERAGTELQRATEIVPEEPAAWANLALRHMGTGNAQEATKALEKALANAGSNSRLELLAGLLASRQGRPQEALPHLRRAIKLDPNNLRARKALIQELERQGGPDAERQMAEQVDAIRNYQPDNLWALIEATRIAAREGNAENLRARFAALKAHARIWPAEDRKYLTELETAVNSGDMRAVGTRAALLGNVLKRTPAYRQSMDALGGNPVQAEPFEQFLRLPSPPATPAPPDAQIAFDPKPIAIPRAQWVRAACLSPAPPAESDKVPVLDGPIAFLYAASLPDGGWELGAAIGQGAPRTIARGKGRLAPEQALLVDWDNPAEQKELAYRLDLALADAHGVRLVRQLASGEWQEITASARLPAEIVNGSYTGVWAIDVDLDGDLDLVLGTASGSPPVLRNNGDGTWGVIRPFTDLDGLRDLVWADFDGDGDADVAARDGKGQLVLLENKRLGFYHRWPGPDGMGEVLALAVAEVNRDAALDLVTLSPDGAIRRLSYREANGLLPGGGESALAAAWDMAELARWDGASAAGGSGPSATSGARLFCADVDNNGATDLIASAGGRAQVWLGDGQGQWSPVDKPPAATVDSVFDLTGDGRLDMTGVAGDGAPVRILNSTKSPTRYHSVVLRPRSEPNVRTEGDSGNTKINPFGLGGEAEIRSGLLAQKLPILGPVVHFGLGAAQRADYVRLIWPNGQPQGEFGVAADRPLLAKQRLTGSCPWLFAHDGEGWKFVTDILWKSPLGLRINAQATASAQTRDWVKVRGDQLKARDGFYDLSITAELWETNFFDHVSLMVVDHPVGTEIWVDERFSVPQPPLEIITTGPVQPVVRATDDRGRDVTEVVRTRDGRYLDGFPLGRYQGVARDHYVEVQLPPVAAPGSRLHAPGSGREPGARSRERAARRYLVCQGWVYPTDSSINVALSQGRHEPPRGLSLEAPDGMGGWITVKSGLGFPAGKHKTVLIDLRDALAASRFRLRTNLEIYWDAIGVAEALPGTALERVSIPPETADLRYRGFSQTIQERRSEPEVPNYNVVAGTGQQWLDLVGYYTRFGDVRELLARVDDRYVIMNAGDEIRLRIPAKAEPPPGWTRDYIFVSDGWDKDGNFNTVYGQTVLPLPSHDWPEYDRGRLEEDPVYRRYPRDWEIFHTRYVTPRAFRRALWPGGG
jgi:tetratricopeptide (TPR) repeat protein